MSVERPMPWKGWLLAVALAGSLAANVVQLARPGAEGEGAPPSDRTIRAAERGREGSEPRVAVGKQPALSCEAQVRALEEQRAAIVAQIEDQRPVVERYEQGTPDPVQTAELRATVDRVFAAAGIFAPFELSCRGPACKLEFGGVAPSPSEWQAALFGSPDFVERVEDEVTTGPARAVFPLRRDRSRGESKAALLRVLKGFKHGPDASRCSSRHPAAGRLDVALWIPDDGEETPATAERLSNGVTMWVGGELADTTFGACIAGFLREAVLAASLPAHQAPAKVATNFVMPAS